MTSETDLNDSHDPQFDPIVSLPEQVIPSLEEDEEVLFTMRAKLFRWSKESDPPEWKERGTGDVKLLKHKTSSRVRILMRRDKTFKICANHYLDKRMKLQPNCNSDRAWVWNTFADFSEEEAREELLAIRFLNAENANKFKEKFEECQSMLPNIVEKEKIVVKENGDSGETEPASVKEKAEIQTNEVTKKLQELVVKENTEPDKTHAEAEKPEELKTEANNEVTAVNGS